MVNNMNAIVYSKNDCPFCTMAKSLLTAKGVEYTEVRLGEDILREDFAALFPNISSVPFIIIDEQHIAGYNALVEHLDNRKQFLVE